MFCVFLSAPMKCLQDEFACSNGACLKKNWHCDGRDDCSDGSDEKNCSKFSCCCVSLLVSDPMLLKSSICETCCSNSVQSRLSCKPFWVA